ncbi:hypothetical protein RSAG8_12812, partial [Rhizoctonia solani AG-8 WAC10335]
MSQFAAKHLRREYDGSYEPGQAKSDEVAATGRVLWWEESQRYTEDPEDGGGLGGSKSNIDLDREISLTREAK